MDSKTSMIGRGEKIQNASECELNLPQELEMLRLAMEASQAAVWDWDVVANKSVCDKRFYSMYGIPDSEQSLHEVWLSRCHPDCRSRLIARINRIIETPGDERWREEIHLVLPDGQHRWVEEHGFVRRNEAGQAIRFSGISIDITGRRQAEQSLRESEEDERERASELAALLDAAPTPIFIAHDADCIHITGNPAADELLRNPRGGEASFSAPEDLRPRHFKPVRDGRDLSPDELPSQRAAKGERIKNFDFDLVFEDGSVRHVLSNASPLFGEQGRLRGSVQVLTDITDLKTAEKALRELKAGLEAMVAERTAELKTANERLQQQADQLRQLAGESTMTELRERKRLAKVLHDGLQQHLVTAKLQVGGLVHPAYDLETREAVTYIERILNDALKVSRTLAAELSPPILHYSGLLACLEWLARWNLEKHGLRVEVEVETLDVPRVADDVKVFLFEAVRELLLNVVKHARTQTARVHLAGKTGSSIQIAVSDDGVGFDMAFLVDGLKTSEGFGLFSIRERMALIDGSLQCDSSPGKGARFTLTVPLEAPTPQDAAPPEFACRKTDRLSVSGPGSQKCRILIADDHR